jgi:hypothetical protein
MVLKELKTTIDVHLKRKGLNFKKMALDLGLSQAGAHRMFENGSLKITVLEDMAKYLGTSANKVLKESYSEIQDSELKVLPPNERYGEEYIEQSIHRIRREISILDKKLDSIKSKLDNTEV